MHPEAGRGSCEGPSGIQELLEAPLVSLRVRLQANPGAQQVM